MYSADKLGDRTGAPYQSFDVQANSFCNQPLYLMPGGSAGNATSQIRHVGAVAAFVILFDHHSVLFMLQSCLFLDTLQGALSHLHARMLAMVNVALTTRAVQTQRPCLFGDLGFTACALSQPVGIGLATSTRGIPCGSADALQSVVPFEIRPLGAWIPHRRD